MRLPSILAAAVLLVEASGAQAGYDKNWHITAFWSGEWPNGFVVAEPGVAVPARSAMDRDAPPSISCTLPYKAVFHPWNEERNRLSKARYVTASRIVPLIARADFDFQPDDGSAPVAIARGDTIEYLIYGAEGYFSVRIGGREYTASQELFDSMEPVADDAFQQDEWLQLRCENGKRAWIFMGDIMRTAEDGRTAYADGLWAVMAGSPGIEDYGIARDLTDEEIAAGIEMADDEGDPAGATAGYDESWYTTDFWSGEYPNGVAVAKPDVVIQARAAMVKGLAPSVACALPYKAVFHPWNEERNRLSEARYLTASKIVPLTARVDFTYQPYEDGAAPIPIKKGQLIEYLIYGAEGYFRIRIGGTEYEAGQELFDNIEPVGDDAFVQEEWLNLRCGDGQQAWIYMNELANIGEDGQVTYPDGLWVVGGGGPGFVEYGLVRDLTDAEIAAGLR
jgi:hypothetical protein